MDWTKLPKEDVIYINHDEFTVANPITKSGSLYIEKGNLRCKVGNGDRYNSVSYTPWSISTDAASVEDVSNIISSLDGVNTTSKYIWDGESTYPKGYILSFYGNIWHAAIPADNSFAWVSIAYKLYFWDGDVWTSVGTNSHNTQFGLEGGDGSHYYHLSESQYVGLTSVDGSLYLTKPAVELINKDHIIFSNGSGGTFTNGIKTNDHNQLDLNYNRVKNAVIDCGAFYG